MRNVIKSRDPQQDNQFGFMPPFNNMWGWWNASNAYTDAGKTTLCSSSGSDTCYTLSDLSGNSRDLVQSTAGNRPTWYSSQLNGYPSLRFDGSNDQLTYTGGMSSAGSWYFVVKQNTYTLDDYLLRIADATSGVVIRQSSSGNLLFGDTLGGNITVAASLGSYLLIQAVQNGASSEMTINTTRSTASQTNSTGQTLIRLGSDNTGFIDADICEILAYSTGHTSTTGDGLSVRKYLNSKYQLGLSL